MGWAGTVLPNGNQNNRPMKGIQCNHPQNYLALKAAKVFGNQISFQSPADRRLHVKSASFVDRSFWTSGLTDCNSTWRMQSMSHAARSSWSWRLSLTFPNTFKVWKMWNRNRQAMNIRCVWKGEPACVYWGLMHRNGWSQNSSRVRPLTSLSSTTNNTMWMGILWRKLKTGPVFSIKTLSQNLMPILLNNAITIYYLLPTSKKNVVTNNDEPNLLYLSLQDWRSQPGTCPQENQAGTRWQGLWRWCHLHQESAPWPRKWDPARPNWLYKILATWDHLLGFLFHFHSLRSSTGFLIPLAAPMAKEEIPDQFLRRADHGWGGFLPFPGIYRENAVSSIPWVVPHQKYYVKIVIVMFLILAFPIKLELSSFQIQFAQCMYLYV